MPSQKRYAHTLVRDRVKKAMHIGDARSLAKHLLRAFDHARRWAAMNDTREAVMRTAHQEWVVAPFRIVSPQQMSNGEQSVVMDWIRYASQTYMQHVRAPTGGLVIPMVWRNHYTVLLIPRDPQMHADWFDPNYLGRRAYPSLDVTALQQAAGRPVRVQSFHTHGRAVEGGLQNDGIHDVFCAVWVLWYMTHGVGRGPAPMQKPHFVDVFRFLQRTVHILRAEFHEYLLDQSLSTQEAGDVIATIRSVNPEMYKRAFYHSTI